MAGKTQERLLKEFSGLFDGEASGMDALATGDGGLTQSLSKTITQLGQAVAGLTVNPMANESPGASVTSQEEADQPAAHTESMSEAISDLGQMSASSPADALATPAGTNTRGGTPQASGSSDSGTSVESIATSFLESGFGIVPLITSLVGLFSGGSDTPPALERYVMPSAISFDSADTGGTLTAADFDQTGAPRVYDAGAGDTTGSGNSAPSSPGATAGGAAATPQITVNVQAMDAQSFMDYSSQIAQAVRGAMLNLSSLNDVVNEL